MDYLVSAHVQHVEELASENVRILLVKEVYYRTARNRGDSLVRQMSCRRSTATCAVAIENNSIDAVNR